MSTLKTQPSDKDVHNFLEKLNDDKKRQDSKELIKIMKEITGAEPVMWGPSIIGFGSYHYKYESGREGDWFLTGFSPRKQNMTVYIVSGFDRHKDLIQQLGKHKTGKSCLYFKRLKDIDEQVLSELIELSIAHLQKEHP